MPSEGAAMDRAAVAVQMGDALQPALLYLCNNVGNFNKYRIERVSFIIIYVYLSSGRTPRA